MSDKPLYQSHAMCDIQIRTLGERVNALQMELRQVRAQAELLRAFAAIKGSDNATELVLLAVAWLEADDENYRAIHHKRPVNEPNQLRVYDAREAFRAALTRGRS